ncbi:glycosyltransferase family 2 protein [Aegicerativicinus sediminis]|uniref:glycosyltransferase family 2 protein n=1 Tax=Aegicerativicinus sediminis TaxID=2893202 RepID=UPI001E4368DC|nr:glycosyltransferase family A protein [Aegicerativicinus sediminis]
MKEEPLLSSLFFFKYLHSTHYFRLLNMDGNLVFPLWENLPQSIKDKIELCQEFKSELSKRHEASYRTILKGYLGEVEHVNNFQEIPLEDNYRFLRRYVSPFWVLYVLVVRILSFHNIYKEILAWHRCKNEHRINYWEQPIVQDYNNELGTVSDSQLVSVIIPTLNRYVYLKDVLNDLENQTYSNFEVIVVDQSDNFNNNFYDQFNLNLNIIYQQEKELWKARNHAIKMAKGDFILLFDDDSRVEKDWIKYHIKILEDFEADISSGVSFSVIGAEVPKHYSYLKISDQLDTGNVMIKRNVFKKIGLFDRQFEGQRMGDGEFGCRAFKNNLKNISNPFAHRIHLKVDSGGLREKGSWDAFRPSKWIAPRPIPSVIYFFRRYFGRKATLFALLKNVPLGLVPYQYKQNKLRLIISILSLIILFPVVLIQVMWSWRLASLKLKEGPLIDQLP